MNSNTQSSGCCEMCCDNHYLRGHPRISSCYCENTNCSCHKPLSQTKEGNWEEEFERACMDTSALAGLTGGRKAYMREFIKSLLISEKEQQKEVIVAAAEGHMRAQKVPEDSIERFKQRVEDLLTHKGSRV